VHVITPGFRATVDLLRRAFAFTLFSSCPRAFFSMTSAHQAANNFGKIPSS